MGGLLRALVWVGAASASAGSPGTPEETDVLYEALHGTPQVVDAGTLLDAPGRFVGHAVRTRGRLERSRGGPSPFELSAPNGRAVLRLEPQAAALTGARGAAWIGRAVEVEGFFYREARDGNAGDYALRTWLLRPVSEDRGARGPVPDAPLVSLQELAYGAGRYDGRLVRVRGSYRGANLHRDLPEASRKGTRDWVLKDGYFAAWVSGREDPMMDHENGSPAEADVALEVVGVPTTSDGVVRLAARDVEVSLGAAPATVGRALATGDAGWAAVRPRLSFVYPVPGEPLRPSGQLILQFSKPMDPARFEAGVRVRYERAGLAAGTPRLRFEYRDRYRALVLTPAPPPPPDAEVVVELLDGLIDVDGRALEPASEPIRFRSRR